MTTQQKHLILGAVEQAIIGMGSASKVATKCGLNDAYISLMRNQKWSLPLKDEHWMQAAQALGVNLTGWQMVDITNTRLIHDVLRDARENSMFLAVSHPAGSGKTAACRNFREAYANQAVFYYCVEHGDMNKVDFLRRLAQNLGIDTRGQGYLSANRLADLVIEYFTRRLDQRPLLIIDEADKLSDKAKRFFISLYNAVEGQMGCVILGTENLEKQIKTGVIHSRNGYDEIDSRFGRRFIKLVGINQREAAEICRANGLNDAALHKALFEECEPVNIIVGGKSGTQANMRIIKDIRPLRRKIEREILKRQGEQAEAAAA